VGIYHTNISVEFWEREKNLRQAGNHLGEPGTE